MSDNWCTPQWLVERVERVGRIALDPCWNENALTTPVEALTESDNGLAPSWVASAGLVYCNPPYSKPNLPIWANKIATEALAGCEIISLVPASTDTEWWRTLRTTAAAIAFLDRRVKFIGERNDGARHASAVFYHGEQVGRFACAFADCAWVVQL